MVSSFHGFVKWEKLGYVREKTILVVKKKKIHGKDISDKYNIVKGLLFGMCVGDHLTNQKKKEEKKWSQKKVFVIM